MTQIIGKQIATAVQTRHQVGNHATITADKTLHGVSVVSIPLHPSLPGKFLPQLKLAISVPGFSNQPIVTKV